jgi:hypothetical protein
VFALVLVLLWDLDLTPLLDDVCRLLLEAIWSSDACLSRGARSEMNGEDARDP